MSRENQQYFIFASWKNSGNECESDPRRVGERVEREQALPISTIRRWIAIFKDEEEEIKDKAFWTSSRSSDVRENCQGRGNNPHISIKE